jgi:serine protease Do
MTSNAPATAANPLLAHSQYLAALVEQVGASTLAVLGRQQAIASAVLWRPGLVVTAAHVFRRTPAAITLVGAEGITHAATMVGIDSATDLALFRLSVAGAAAGADGGLVPVVAGDASGVRAGHVVVAVGRSGDGDAIASSGLVNRAGGPWQTWLGGHVDRLIRLDGGVYEGLSGAAVADAAGSVVGIATAALSRSYGIVVPASTVDRVVDALLAHGHVARPWLGIGAQAVPLPGDSARSGLLVTSLGQGGPAERAGVMVGDILYAAAGESAGNLRELRQALVPHVGKTVPLALLRGGVAAELQAQVDEWPQERRSCR